MEIASIWPTKLEQSMLLTNRLASHALSVLALFFVMGFCTSVSFADNPDYTPGEILVGFKSSATSSDIIAFEKVHSLMLLKEFSPLHLRHYRLPETLSVNEARQLLTNDPIVDYVEPNYISKPMALPADPRFVEQWSLHNIGQVVNGSSGTSDIDIDWPEAMDIYSGTTAVIVAVIDSGVGIDHPDFDETSIWLNNAESLNYPDFIDNDGNGKPDDLFGWDFFDNDPLPLDENGHGTLVASIIGENVNNGIGGAGVSPRAQIMALRVGNDFGQIADTAMLDASLYAASMGARIINYSAGGPAYSSSVQSLINYLDQQGILFVVAAGNGGDDGFGDNNDSTPVYPSSYTNLNILSVAANDRTGGLSYFSNYGASSVDLAAPGTDIFGADITRSTTFFESFETGGAGWTVGHIFDLSTLDWTFYQDAYGRTWVADSVSNFGTPINYQPYTDSWLASPSINAGLVGTQLQYRISYDLEFLFDYLAVEVTRNGGLTWDLVDAVTGFSYSECPSCSLNAGKIRSVDLSDYDGQSIKFRFRLISDGSGQYDGAYIDDVKLTKVNLLENDNNYQHNNGTSFSAPLVSGVAALIMSQRPDLSHREVRQIIIDSVDRVSALSGKVATGGRLNARSALEAAIAFPKACVGTFMDVYCDYWAFTNIETLVTSGITKGCGSNNYCPESSVTRAQMAVFLERGMRGSDYNPGAGVGNVFQDVPASYWAAGWIELLYSDGITTGCGFGNYCPEDAVTREQMAVFLLRAKYGQDYAPPTPTGVFNDVVLSHWSAPWIEQLAKEGITTGCGNNNYCPKDSVTRAQMAVFLVRTFELE